MLNPKRQDRESGCVGGDFQFKVKKFEMFLQLKI